MKFNLGLIVILLYTTIIVCSAEDNYRRVKRERDDALSEYFQSVVEGFQLMMPRGVQEFNLPPLDPYHLDHKQINYFSKQSRFNLTLDDVNIVGLSDFVIRAIDVDLENLAINMSLLHPSIRGTGMYVLSGVALSIFPLRGNGSWWIELTNATSEFQIKLDHQEDTQQLRLRRVLVEGDFDDFDSHFEHLLGSGNFNQVINKIIRKNGKFILHSTFTLLRQEIQKELQKYFDISDAMIHTSIGGW